ncbi:type II TA system antitoxin MqsA family protein [Novosphingobium lentum]|uniref:type II TA system antitoxin MqsA family protein n=1 Tax=Novosphingobium lentum TaxID=145287 RepID=UPI000AA1E7DA|nr:type II TA system antitoxin MqsA family protein [Novosphingobium lentum]
MAPDDGSGSIHSGTDLQTLNGAYKELRVAYAARVKAVRKKLRLTQEEAGRIIGGGRRAFQKYESGTTPPSDAAVGLLEILDHHPEELETLKSIRPRTSPTDLLTEAASQGRGETGARAASPPEAHSSVST